MFILASELFQPLLAEVTHNETADPSMTFHLPEHNVPDSPEELPDWDRALSEESPERLRTEEPITCVMASPASHGSFSQHHACKSVLVLSPPTMMTDVELSALSLSKLTMCDQTPAVPQPEVLYSNVSAGQLKSEQSSNPGENFSYIRDDNGVIVVVFFTLVFQTQTHYCSVINGNSCPARALW